MYTECPNCNNEYVKNNFCTQCRSSIFNIPSNIEDRKNNSEYSRLVNNIKKKTNLESPLVENLINLNYLSIIPHIEIVPEFESFHSIAFSIPEYIYDNQYQKNIFFIFSKLNLYHTNYSIENVLLNSIDTRIMLKNNNLKNKSYIESPAAYLKNKITIYLQYIENDTIPYDIGLLNSEELENLQFNLEEQVLSDNFSITCWTEDDEINNSFFQKNIDINLDDDLNSIYEKIKFDIDSFQNEVDLIMEQLIENNKKFFERSLLEKQMETF